MAATAQLVKELRDRTGAGVMDCKEALQASAGELKGRFCAPCLISLARLGAQHNGNGSSTSSRSKSRSKPAVNNIPHAIVLDDAIEIAKDSGTPTTTK